MNNHLLFLVLFFCELSQAHQPCTRAWALDGQVKSKNYIFGVGLSSKNEPIAARDEAKQNAMKDVVQQLQSSVSSHAKLSETDSNSTYEGLTEVRASGAELTGLKLVKEGSDSTSGITQCQVVKFDVSAVYNEYEGRMEVLESTIDQSFKDAKDKKYIAVLKSKTSIKNKIESELPNIRKADMYLAFLKTDEKSWFKKIKEKELEIDKIVNEAKEKIVFIIPQNSEFTSSISEMESKISGEGFEVQGDTKAPHPVKISFEIKPIGAPRKTKTALGISYIQKISISLKEGTKTIATNKGAQVIGTGPNEDDALANIDRQLFTHMLGVLNEGLPGVFPEN